MFAPPRFPDSLLERLELFRVRGRIPRQDRGLFQDPSWLAVLVGQGVLPRDYDCRVSAMSQGALSQALARMRLEIDAASEPMPSHERYLASYCPAEQVDA